MTRIAWMTDIHLNFLRFKQIDHFLDTVNAADPDVVLIAGDIGEAHTFAVFLDRFETRLQRPVYYVLGNHDFYFGSIAGVRSIAERLTEESQWLHWLPHEGVVELTPDTGLVGHDGWADGRYGDYAHSTLLLNDYLLIQELAGLPSAPRLEKLNQFGDEAAAYLRRVLPQALERFRQVYVLTHVPPFKDACLYQGVPSDDDSLPHFASKAVGDALLDSAKQWPEHDITVLCGHTHNEAHVQVLPNLLVHTGGAEYGEPVVQDIIEVDLD